MLSNSNDCPRISVVITVTNFFSGWFFVPWLFLNMILVIGCFVGALTLFIWFTFVYPVLIFSLLAIIPVVGGVVLLYWQVHTVLHAALQYSTEKHLH